eukprot:CAMPEP_0194135088 /NCGR_PEP_ID=MMETSP0152-20130528/5180_1 /TAXON_ID=1049557 /ORGANISM="Thalassiothrix antarctica, Strain L6-D1" /LENGTH=85 /DNA_ID=CAMNT_0038831141 /DNA_START=20 /DNA_END=274 /DNA_ORIENTATION=+
MKYYKTAFLFLVAGLQIEAKITYKGRRALTGESDSGDADGNYGGKKSGYVGDGDYGGKKGNPCDEDGYGGKKAGYDADGAYGGKK